MKRIWWKEAIGYEIYPRTFYDSNGDGSAICRHHRQA
jgi:alpha-glucosidase